MARSLGSLLSAVLWNSTLLTNWPYRYLSSPHTPACTRAWFGSLWAVVDWSYQIHPHVLITEMSNKQKKCTHKIISMNKIQLHLYNNTRNRVFFPWCWMDSGSPSGDLYKVQRKKNMIEILMNIFKRDANTKRKWLTDQVYSLLYYSWLGMICLQCWKCFLYRHRP